MSALYLFLLCVMFAYSLWYPSSMFWGEWAASSWSAAPPWAGSSHASRVSRLGSPQKYNRCGWQARDPARVCPALLSLASLQTLVSILTGVLPYLWFQLCYSEFVLPELNDV